MSLVQLIGGRNYIIVNKTLIKVVGKDEALLLGELASEQSTWEDQGKLKDGYFFSTVENIEENTTLSAYQQRTALAKLKKLGLVDTKVIGLPARRYIKIDDEKLLSIVYSKSENASQTSCKKTSELRSEKTSELSCEEISELDAKELNGNNNKTKNNNTNNNNRNINDNINPILYSSPCEIEKKVKEVKHTYGEYENVKFTDTELAKLKEEFPNDWQNRIENLSGYIASTGKKYTNHLATIRNWARKEREKAEVAKQPDPNDGWAYLEEQFQKGEL